MHRTDSSLGRHAHVFALDSAAAERSTRIVVGITAAMMVFEIIAGLGFHSMALLADGWHMGTHVAAFLIAALAYSFSRRHADDPRFSFGTGKMGVLGGFASAVVLSVVALLVAGESAHRFVAPLTIHFNEAIAVAVAGLVVNLTCAFLLKGAHDHPLSGGHHHEPAGDRHRDLNLRAAYLHVLADAFTTLTAIGALLAGKFFGWAWLDPVVGLVGSAVVFSWAYTLLRDTSGILLDRTPEASDLPAVIRQSVESDGDLLVTDLHIWQVAAGKFAAIVSIVAHEPKPTEFYHRSLQEHEELVHITIETQLCPGHEPATAGAC